MQGLVRTEQPSSLSTAEYAAWQALRRHLLGFTWPPVTPLSDEEIQRLPKPNSDGASPSALLNAAEAMRWKGDDAKVSALMQAASPGLNVPTPTDDTVVDILRISVLYESLGKFEEANISLTRASKALAKVQNASPGLQVFIDVASLILAVKQDSFAEFKVKQFSICGAVSKLPKGGGVFGKALLADFFAILGKWNEAESLYDQALSELASNDKTYNQPPMDELLLCHASALLARDKLDAAAAKLATLETVLKRWRDEAKNEAVAATFARCSLYADVIGARIAHAQGRHGAAQQQIEMAVTQLRSSPFAYSLATSNAVIEAASLSTQLGLLIKAEELLTSIATLRRLSATNPLSLSYALALSSLRMRQGAIKEAEAVLVEKLTELKSRKPATCEYLAAAPLLRALASVYADSGRLEDAAGLLTDALAIRKRVLHEDHAGLVPDLLLHARILYLSGHEGAAEALWTRITPVAARMSPLAEAEALSSRGQTLAMRGDDKGEALLVQARALRAKSAGDSPSALVAELDVLVAELHLAREQLKKANEFARAAVNAAKAAGALEVESSALLCVSRSLSERDYAEREATAERAWTLRRERQGPAAPRTVEALMAVVAAYDAHSKIEEATALLQFALRALKKERPDMDDPMLVHILHQLALHYWDMEQSEEAVALATQSVELSKRLFGPSHPFTAAVLDGAALIFDDAEMSTEAEEAKQAAAAIRAQLQP